MLLLSLLTAGVWASCVNYQALGYYGDGKVYIAGLPPANAKTYVTLPGTLTPCDLETLQNACIDRINQYRNGTLRFTNGQADPGVPKPRLNHNTNNNRCANAMAFGDLWSNGGAGGCTAGHKNAFACPGSNSGQNSCCYRSGTTVTAIQNQLFGCLQQMWDEGQGLADNAAFTSANGHWYNMRANNNIWASCSFAFTSDGGLWMNQDFFTAGQNTCACPGAAGTSDSCSGTCYGTGGGPAACTAAYVQGGYTVSGCAANTASGSACTATCAAQFAGTVTGTVSCTNGAYTGSFSGCVPYCPANAGWPATVPGVTANMACPPGQVGSITRMCNSVGTWQSQVVSCQTPANCTDRIQNQDETCIDCGGTVCPACQPCDCVNCGTHGNCTNGTCTCLDGWTGAQCNTPPDPCFNVNCLNGGMCSGGVCTCVGGFTGANCGTPPPPSCTDGIKNQNETAIDCGGVCPPCPTFQWVAGPWTNCSVTCGGGNQQRNVECAYANGTIAPAENCSSLHPLDLSQLCNIDPCPSFTWITGPWSVCSSPCNSGFQTRSVQCQSSVGPTVVSNSFCTVNSQPASQQTCNTNVCTGYHWESTAWTTCTVTCGGGTQTRTVSCLDINNTAASASLCEVALTPPTQQSCNLQLCDSYKWQACPSFLPCTAQCNGGGSMVGIQYRDVFCLRQSDKVVVDASLCTDPSPTTALSVCNTQPCTTYNWMANANWGPCEMDASGLYSRNRTFHCHSASGQVALNSDCATYGGKMPIDRIPCSPGVCSDANGCPLVQIGSFFNFCSDIPASCLPYSSCLTVAKELDDSFASLGTPANTAAQCVQSFNDARSPVDRFPQTLIDAVKARLASGLPSCQDGITSSASVVSVGVAAIAMIAFV